MKNKTILFILSLSTLLGCTNGQKVDSIEPTKAIAMVNGEELTENDLEKSQVWMPAFARQLESNSTVEITRFWSLVQVMLMAQEAAKLNYLSPAEKSLAIKEALAKYNIHNLNYPNYVITDDEIAKYQQEHPNEFYEPDSFTVSYALIKSEKTISTLTAALGLANSAQMGYIYIDPPELNRKNMTGPLMQNRDGHAMNAKKFNFSFVMTARENTDEPGQLGPFTAKDDLLFSCPEAIETLKVAPLGKPISKSIACSGTWKAFVIPEWRREASPMSSEKARQTAIERITAHKRKAYLEEYVASANQRVVPDGTHGD